MEELKAVIQKLHESHNQLLMLQQINDLILRNYTLSLHGCLEIIPKEIEIYHVNKNANIPFVDTNMHCIEGFQIDEEIWKLQSGRFGQLYFHQKGSGGIDICLSDSPDYALCCTLKSAEVNGEDLWGAQKVRNRLVEIVCREMKLETKEEVKNWMNRVNTLPLLRRREKRQEGDVYHIRRKGLKHRDKNVYFPLRSFMDLWNKGLAINSAQKLMIYMDKHPNADILDVLRQQNFRFIPSEIRIKYNIGKKVKLY